MNSRFHARAALAGLVALLWIAALAKGANDFWAVCVINGGLTLCAALFLTGCYRYKSPLYLPLIFNVLLILAVFLVSSRFSYDSNTSRLELWIWFFSGIAFLLFINIFRDPALRIGLLRVGGLVILPVTLIALCQYMRSPALGPHGSIMSTFTNSAVLAGFSLSWIMIFWHFRHQGLMYRCLLALCLIALSVARSWWSFVCLALGFGVYYREQLRSILLTKPKYAIGLVLLVFTIGFLVIEFKFGLFQDPFNHATDRWSWWLAGMRMVVHHPLVGVGLGGYGDAFPFF